MLPWGRMVARSGMQRLAAAPGVGDAGVLLKMHCMRVDRAKRQPEQRLAVARLIMGGSARTQFLQSYFLPLMPLVGAASQ